MHNEDDKKIQFDFQDELKFTLCDILYSILSLSGEPLVSYIILVVILQ